MNLISAKGFQAKYGLSSGWFNRLPHQPAPVEIKSGKVRKFAYFDEKVLLELLKQYPDIKEPADDSIVTISAYAKEIGIKADVIYNNKKNDEKFPNPIKTIDKFMAGKPYTISYYDRDDLDEYYAEELKKNIETSPFAELSIWFLSRPMRGVAWKMTL